MTTQSHSLVLPYPISANRYWASRTVKPRNGGKSFTTTYVTPEAKAYKAQVERIVLATGICQPILGRVQVDLRLYPHRPQDWQARQRKFGAAWDDTVQCLDLDNARKVVYDALKGLVMDDDAWVRRETGERMEPDVLGARLEVTVTSLVSCDPQAALFGVEAAA
ncbi:RusA family crossover junction endodeoxyribonuclease [Achromobacter sp. E1]|uniref:RusA family crossover junction endodeoxyribonuclease n=1 Tax=Achromobacter sp. E1 TaxID=3141581 RepID=UPI0030D3EF9A